jgi:hypothetical protein
MDHGCKRPVQEIPVMVQSVQATDDVAPSKPRKKKTKRAKRTQLPSRSWPSRAIRSLVTIAGFGLAMALGAVLGRASARA